MNLQVCDNGHDEITYYGAYKDCPFCKYIKEQEDKEEEIATLADDLAEVQREYYTLEDDYLEECEKLKAEIEVLKSALEEERFK